MKTSRGGGNHKQQTTPVLESRTVLTTNTTATDATVTRPPLAPWAKHPPKRVRCTVCDENYSSVRQAAMGCGYSAGMVSQAVNGKVAMPHNHNWILLSENSND